MGEIVSVKADLDEAMDMLSELDGNRSRMRRRILSGVGIAVKNTIKKRYRSFFHNRTGTLYKSLVSKVMKNGKAVIVSPVAENNGVRYGYVLSKGSTIEPRNGEFLTFRIGDKWIRKKRVTIPEKDWVVGPARKFLEGGEMKTRLEKLTQREIDRAEKAAAKKAGK